MKITPNTAPTSLTVLCDGLDDALEQLVVVDDVEEVEGEEVALEERAHHRQSHEQLRAEQMSALISNTNKDSN